MLGLVVIEVMTLSGHLSNIDEIYQTNLVQDGKQMNCILYYNGPYQFKVVEKHILSDSLWIL